MAQAGLSITDCLTAMSAKLSEAVAITRAAVTCAESGAEREALRIAMDVDEVLHEAEDLHRAMRLIGRRNTSGGEGLTIL